MVTDYNTITQQYQEIRKLLPCPFFHVEQYTFDAIIGDLRGKSVLDLACGNGYYSRRFKLYGASNVVGVDVSESLIELAKLEEEKQQLGINYIHSDVSELGWVDDFDLVTAVYLLYYAQNEDQLFTMCRNIFANLKLGGSFISFDENLEQSLESYSICNKYGYSKKFLGSHKKQGSNIEINFVLPSKQQMNLVGYYYSRETYESAFLSAGFREVRWHKPLIPEHAIYEYSEDFWHDFITYQPLVCIECLK